MGRSASGWWQLLGSGTVAFIRVLDSPDIILQKKSLFFFLPDPELSCLWGMVPFYPRTVTIALCPCVSELPRLILQVSPLFLPFVLHAGPQSTEEDLEEEEQEVEEEAEAEGEAEEKGAANP